MKVTGLLLLAALGGCVTSDPPDYDPMSQRPSTGRKK